MSNFLGKEWLKDYTKHLIADQAWAAATAYFSGRIGFRCGTLSGVVEIQAGKVQGVFSSEEALPADFMLVGPEAEWQRVLSGETDFFRGLSEDHGDLTIEGDAAAAMRSAKTMWLALEIMSRVGGTSCCDAVSYSPDPEPSGRAVTGRYIEVDDIRTYYEEAGEGYPLICFHAACQDTLMYRHVLDNLSDKFRVITVDAPGHSKSLMPEAGPFTSLTQHCEFNEKLMDKLGLVRPVILGCSMSGNQVLELGSRRPDKYAAIISAEGADYTPTISKFMLDMLLVNGQQILEGYSQSITGNRTPPDRAREVVWQLIRAVPEVMKGDLAGYAGFDMRSEVGKITAPLLLIRGDADWLVSQQQVDETASRIPCSKVTVLEGTGHYPMIENPVEFNDAVRQFLNEVGIS
ncbi:alpha/beta fold hydrolase [Kordiimonas pumila]|uniref:Alpha/beta fold hydrolase n=1 Tax=Kordiimonas pumila TaxID=2161677 RepID=A0ABV7DB07_9PROT|nr:alpha/beta fold hydrolase [Kordiimonas pumila]